MYVLITPPGQIYFLADTTVNIEPTAEDLAEIAIEAAETARRFDVEPRVAMLSFSNFGSVGARYRKRCAGRSGHPARARFKGGREMQADTAVVPRILDERYPFSVLAGSANVLIFPNLEAGNIAYKLLQRIGGAGIGPILMGLSKPVHVLQRGDEVSDIVNMTAIAVMDAQEASAAPRRRVRDQSFVGRAEIADLRAHREARLFRTNRDFAEGAVADGVGGMIGEFVGGVQFLSDPAEVGSQVLSPGIEMRATGFRAMRSMTRMPYLFAK
jgi:hypothetical protein